MKNGEFRVIVSYEKRVLQTFVCLCIALFGLFSEWRNASLLCAALGVVVLWTWARRQSIVFSGGAVVLQNLCFNLPVGTPTRIDLGDVTEITLYVRLPRRGSPLPARRLYFYRGRSVVARTMGLSDGDATALLDAIEDVGGGRPSVSHEHPYGRFLLKD